MVILATVVVVPKIYSVDYLDQDYMHFAAVDRKDAIKQNHQNWVNFAAVDHLDQDNMDFAVVDQDNMDFAVVDQDYMNFAVVD